MKVDPRSLLEEHKDYVEQLKVLDQMQERAAGWAKAGNCAQTNLGMLSALSASLVGIQSELWLLRQETILLRKDLARYERRRVARRRGQS